MRSIDIGISNIDRIYHIADVHVRNVKRHKEYELVFKRLYKYIQKTKTPNSVIYVAGDIVHAKTDMSPELVATVSSFFKNLADLAPTIIITGNHDCNLNNTSRLDALTPIVNALNDSNIHYLKDTGIYKISNVHFNVMSVFDQPSNFIKASEFEGEFKIALHHGAVNSAETDLGIILSNTHVTTDLFQGHDLVLLGDIHKTQYLNAERTIAYAGSLIQQNFGEGLIHGILVWDLATKQSEFVEIDNDYGYCTFEVDNGVITNKLPKTPKKVRLRLKVKDTESSALKRIVAELRMQFNVQDVTIQKVNTLSSTSNGKKITFGNIRDTEWQNKIITEYLTDEFALDDNMLDCVRHINRTVHSKLSDSEITRNKLWIPKTFEFSNMFSYGEDNVIDFEQLSGTYGLFAPNASGKSTLLDALAFCCFDKCSRTNKAVHVLNNKKTQFKSKFCFEIDNVSYVIERNGRKNNTGHVKVNVDFYYLDDAGSMVSLNGDQRDNTNKIIRQYLGDYEDFVLTALSLQTNNTGFIDKSQKERKELLSQFLDIDVFEQQYQIASEEIRDTAALIREYKRHDHSTTLSEANNIIQTVTVKYNEHVHEKHELENMRNELNEQMLELTKELRTIPNNILGPEIHAKNIEDYKQSISETQLKLQETETKINSLTKLQESITKQLEDFDIDNLSASQTQFEILKSKIAEIQSNIQIKRYEVSHAQAMVSKLTHHQWDPNCKYCVANPWLKETQTSADQLPVLVQELSNLEKELEMTTNSIELYNVKDRILLYHELERQLNTYIQTQSSTSVGLHILENTITQLNNKLVNETELFNKATECLLDIEFNKQQTVNIDAVRVELQAIANEIKELDVRIVTLSGKISIATKSKQTAEQAITRLSELETQYKGYEYYLSAVKRDGVPYHLIERALPQIEAEINNILTQIVDFTIILNTDGKNIHGYIVYDDDNYWPLELTSGMEKFISSLAIRASLINITSLPRPNFLAIDEGFGVLDSDNLNSMYMLFDYLKSQFGFILCISHIDAMRDVVDKLIEIKKEHGYSKIEFS